MVFLNSIELSGFLSFAPDTPKIELTPLNVLIGPNGSGKSNLIEAIEVLRAAPTGLASLMRQGGTAQEWIWKGEPAAEFARIEVRIDKTPRRVPGVAYRLRYPPMKYSLRFSAAGLRLDIEEELIHSFTSLKATPDIENVNVRLKRGRGTLAAAGPRLALNENNITATKAVDLAPEESVLSQRKDPLNYPELTWIAQHFTRIQTFRDWTFGRSAPLRQPQRGDLQIDTLLPGSENLGLLLNEIQHDKVSERFNRLLSRFLPRFERLSTRVYGGAVQFFLHEEGAGAPIPGTRLSDGTIRFMAIVATLLSPTPPPLVCIEEPELGLHPDAIMLLAELLVEASSRMQLIVTTHSPTLISALTDQADSVLVCEHRHGTRISRVDPALMKNWLKDYRLGEIWRIGEIGGNP